MEDDGVGDGRETDLVGVLGELINEVRHLGDEVLVKVEQLPLEPVL
jgi:hypothetical protein